MSKEIDLYYATQGLAGLTDESNCCGYLGESSYDDETDPELDDQNDDQESTEFENEHTQVPEVAQPDEQPQPGKCGFWDFRNKVKQKKAELKAQYGKGSFQLKDLTACGIAPVRVDITKYNPIVRIGESKVCIGWEPSCSKKCLGICCGPTTCVNWQTITPGNTQAYDAATARFNADKAAWDLCRSQNGPWKRGWRSQWRKFVRNGGLKQLAQQCKAEMQGATPTPTPTIISDTTTGGGATSFVQPSVYSKMSCQQLSDKYGIEGGRSWGQAQTNEVLRNAWIGKGCNTKPSTVSLPADEETTPEIGSRTAGVPEEPKSKMFLIVGIVLVIAVAGFFLMRTLKTK